jgi:F-type H+-transporting ATPase subunit delta
MSALRLVSSVARRAPRSSVLGRRGYAEVTDKIKLSLVLPHEVRLRARLTCLLSCP